MTEDDGLPDLSDYFGPDLFPDPGPLAVPPSQGVTRGPRPIPGGGVSLDTKNDRAMMLISRLADLYRALDARVTSIEQGLLDQQKDLPVAAPAEAELDPWVVLYEEFGVEMDRMLASRGWPAASTNGMSAEIRSIAQEGIVPVVRAWLANEEVQRGLGINP